MDHHAGEPGPHRRHQRRGRHEDRDAAVGVAGLDVDETHPTHHVERGAHHARAAAEGAAGRLDHLAEGGAALRPDELAADMQAEAEIDHAEADVAAEQLVERPLTLAAEAVHRRGEGRGGSGKGGIGEEGTGPRRQVIFAGDRLAGANDRSVHVNPVPARPANPTEAGRHPSRPAAATLTRPIPRRQGGGKRIGHNSRRKPIRPGGAGGGAGPTRGASGARGSKSPTRASDRSSGRRPFRPLAWLGAFTIRPDARTHRAFGPRRAPPGLFVSSSRRPARMRPDLTH